VLFLASDEAPFVAGTVIVVVILNAFFNGVGPKNAIESETATAARSSAGSV
jgi:hypothetical protein